ncbi:MAG: hypothetical protein Q9193_006343, partial [Seirophora villosa]
MPFAGVVIEHQRHQGHPFHLPARFSDEAVALEQIVHASQHQGVIRASIGHVLFGHQLRDVFAFFPATGDGVIPEFQVRRRYGWEEVPAESVRFGGGIGRQPLTAKMISNVGQDAISFEMEPSSNTSSNRRG